MRKCTALMLSALFALAATLGCSVSIKPSPGARLHETPNAGLAGQRSPTPTVRLTPIAASKPTPSPEPASRQSNIPQPAVTFVPVSVGPVILLGFYCWTAAEAPGLLHYRMVFDNPTPNRLRLNMAGPIMSLREQSIEGTDKLSMPASAGCTQELSLVRSDNPAALLATDVTVTATGVGLGSPVAAIDLLVKQFFQDLATPDPEGAMRKVAADTTATEVAQAISWRRTIAPVKFEVGACNVQFSTPASGQPQEPPVWHCVSSVTYADYSRQAAAGTWRSTVTNDERTGEFWIENPLGR